MNKRYPVFWDLPDDLEDINNFLNKSEAKGMGKFYPNNLASGFNALKFTLELVGLKILKKVLFISAIHHHLGCTSNVKMELTLLQIKIIKIMENVWHTHPAALSVMDKIAAEDVSKDMVLMNKTNAPNVNHVIT